MRLSLVLRFYFKAILRINLTALFSLLLNHVSNFSLSIGMS